MNLTTLLAMAADGSPDRRVAVGRTEDGLTADRGVVAHRDLALAGAAGLFEPALETFHPATRVHELLFARVERMTL